jgi:hypothetical protein
MHIVGEGGGGVTAGDLFGDQTVGLEIRSETAIPFRDAKGKETRGIKVSIILDGEGSLAIVPSCARCEVLDGKLAGTIHEFLLTGGRSHVHLESLLREEMLAGDMWRYS